jgi:Putative Actinobacterial Holin-X, holin superfamily III
MPTPSPEANGVGATVREAATHASALARLEIELATLELKRKVAALGIGAGAAVGAALAGLFGLAFFLAAAGAALTLVLPVWAALLVMGGACLLLLAAPLGLVALRSIRRGAPPVPERAIEEARLTTEVVKGHARR